MAVNRRSRARKSVVLASQFQALRPLEFYAKLSRHAPVQAKCQIQKVKFVNVPIVLRESSKKLKSEEKFLNSRSEFDAKKTKYSWDESVEDALENLDRRPLNRPI